jgi:DNA-binding MarR family transcriptional regulator
MPESKRPESTPVPSSGNRSRAVRAFHKPETYRSEESVVHLMRRIVTAAGQSVESLMCEPGSPTYPQWVPLHKLHAGEAATVAELARECQLDTGAMTRLLDRLEAKDLCRRVRSMSDRRVVNIELTDEGRVAAEQMPHLICSVLNQCLAGFSSEEWEQLRGYLRRILDNVQGIAVRKEKNE